MKIGYARVSTRHQSLDLQTQALRDDGCKIIFTDHASGRSRVRKGLARALTRCHAGDVLVVWRLDRLGRDLLDLLSLNATLKERCVSLRVLTGRASALDTSCPEGRIIFTMMAALTEYERDLMSERIQTGIRVARERGARIGRPRKHCSGQGTARTIDLMSAWHRCA